MFVTVSSSELRDTFKDISALNCDTVSLVTDNKKLFITAGSSTVYENVISIKEVVGYMDTVLNVQYLSLHELLGERGDVNIEFAQFGAVLSYKTLKVTLTAVDTIVQRPEESIAEKMLIQDKESLLSALNIFKGLGIFQKTLQIERPLQLHGDYGIIQFPTVWVRVRSSSLQNVITREQATIISKFEPEYLSVTDVVSLYKNNARLVLPVVALPSGDEYMDLINTMHSYGIKETKGLLARVKRLSSTLGVSECCVYVGESTLHFSITKNTVSIVDRTDENIVYSFDTRLEYMLSILSLIGTDNQLELLANEDNVVCIRNTNVSIILSTGR